MKPNERDWNKVESISDVVKEKVTLIREKIAEAEIKSGRSPNSVKLIAVSKYAQPDDGIVASFLKSNLTDLAENRVKNFLEKVSFWGNQYLESALPLPQSSSLRNVAGEEKRKDINWHFIGNLQRNKVRRVLPYVSLIHSVDSWNLLETIERIIVEVVSVNETEESLLHLEPVAHEEIEALEKEEKENVGVLIDLHE